MEPGASPHSYPHGNGEQAHAEPTLTGNLVLGKRNIFIMSSSNRGRMAALAAADEDKISGRN